MPAWHTHVVKEHRDTVFFTMKLLLKKVITVTADLAATTIFIIYFYKSIKKVRKKKRKKNSTLPQSPSLQIACFVRATV